MIIDNSIRSLVSLLKVHPLNSDLTYDLIRREEVFTPLGALLYGVDKYNEI